jgi:hypothetical protein
MSGNSSFFNKIGWAEATQQSFQDTVAAATEAANNAITQAADAEASASSAATSALSASNSASNAAASAATLSGQAAAAAASATAAAGSATTASTSATNAASSVTTATTKANDAATSAAAAAVSATNAATSATSASGSASAASTSATNAAASKTAAATSETNAAASASDAFSSSGTAITQAGIATSEASIAVGQANNAANSATAAATSATNAATSATTASTQAGNASTSATSASTSANSAATSASNAAASATAAANSAATLNIPLPVAADAGKSVIATGASTWALGFVGLSNRIINGGFQIAQRGASFASALSNYTLDRWYGQRGGGAAGVTFSQQTGVGNDTCMFVQRDSGNALTANFNLMQAIESQNIQDRAGKQVVVGLEFETGGTWLGGNIQVWVDEANGLDNGITGTWTTSTKVVDQAPTASKTRYTGTLTLQSGTRSVRLRISNAAWTGTAGAADWVRLYNVSLKPGTVDPVFERRLLQDELKLCERYFEKSFALSQAPVQAAGLNSGELQMRTAGGASAAISLTTRFSTRKRATPTITFYNPAAANGQVRCIDASADGSATTVGANTGEAQLFVVSNASASNPVNGLVGVHWTASAEL